MRWRIPFAIALAATIVVGGASPALAISNIKNTLLVNSSGRYVVSGERTYWQASTYYGQYLYRNPYTSDFECLINARHFYRPRSYAVTGTNAYWSYLAYDSGTRAPAYRNYSGVFWVWQPRTVTNKFTAVARSSGYTRGWQRHWLGQHNWSVSTGTPSVVYTYHY